MEVNNTLHTKKGKLKLYQKNTEELFNEYIHKDNLVGVIDLRHKINSVLDRANEYRSSLPYHIEIENLTFEMDGGYLIVKEKQNEEDDG